MFSKNEGASSQPSIRKSRGTLNIGIATGLPKETGKAAVPPPPLSFFFFIGTNVFPLKKKNYKPLFVLSFLLIEPTPTDSSPPNFQPGGGGGGYKAPAAGRGGFSAPPQQAYSQPAYSQQAPAPVPAPAPVVPSMPQVTKPTAL